MKKSHQWCEKLVGTTLILMQLPKALKGQLPSPEQSTRILEDGI